MTHGGTRRNSHCRLMSSTARMRSKCCARFVVDGGLSIAFQRAFEEPDMWGLLLVDIARHAARAYSRESEYHRGRGAAADHSTCSTPKSTGRPISAAPHRDRRGALSVAIEQHHYDFMAEAIARGGKQHRARRSADRRRADARQQDHRARAQQPRAGEQRHPARRDVLACAMPA